ncbi:hypothetical protein, partial [Streptomyces sp. NPDC021608]|uniref:hypothetical protein n=1 Tax=Streptomyces sp. NPDC021608 TaxID=3154903 RepID=UPI003401203B
MNPERGHSICIGQPRSSTFTAPPEREGLDALRVGTGPGRGRENRLRTSDKVGTAGKENRETKAEDLESTEEIGSEKDLIES